VIAIVSYLAGGFFDRGSFDRTSESTSPITFTSCLTLFAGCPVSGVRSTGPERSAGSVLGAHLGERVTEKRFAGHRAKDSVGAKLGLLLELQHAGPRLGPEDPIDDEPEGTQGPPTPLPRPPDPVRCSPACAPVAIGA
jgi:hypothetical protein